MTCSRAEGLFSVCWEDELSLAEREALEGHMEACAACRGAYEGFVRALEAVQALPRLEVPSDFTASVLARVRENERGARRESGRAPAWRIRFEAWGWRPALAAAALAVVLGAAALVVRPWEGGRSPSRADSPAVGSATSGPAAPAPVTAVRPSEPRPEVAPGTQVARAAEPRRTRPAGRSAAPARGTRAEAAVPDSLFDHAYDLEFALDPVNLRRAPGEQSLRPARPTPASESGRKASLTF